MQTVEAVEVRADIPGVDKEDINVRFLESEFYMFFFPAALTTLCM